VQAAKTCSRSKKKTKTERFVPARLRRRAWNCQAVPIWYAINAPV
jgi:hypothetical protein